MLSGEIIAPAAGNSVISDRFSVISQKGTFGSRIIGLQAGEGPHGLSHGRLHAGVFLLRDFARSRKNFVNAKPGKANCS